MKTGFILINKQPGPTSFRIIAQLRRITGIKKIGHAGTLDPFASGVLVVAIGRESTKKISEHVKLDKEYIADLRLGATTETYDTESVPVLNVDFRKSDIDIKKIDKVIEKFIGEQEQVPPMYSAKKVGGQKLCDLARKGIVVERKPSLVNIYNIEVLKYEWPILQIKVNCSTGTYIRTLGHDIGQKLGCGAYLEELKRTKVGEFDIRDSVKIEDLNSDNWGDFLI